MAIDMKAFHEMFIAECEEFLDLARAQLDREAADICELYRYAHSIKGGADTFGFADLAALARALEGLLQWIRDGSACLDAEIALAAREAFDVLREQLSALRGGPAPLPGVCAAMITRLTILHEARARGSGVVPMCATTLYDLRFTLGRMVVGSEVLIEDMLKSLAELGKIHSVHRPLDAASDPVWHIGVASTHTLEELRAVLERIAEPDSLSVAPRGCDGAVDVVVDPVSAGEQEATVADETSDVSLDIAEVDAEAPRPYLVFVVDDQLYAVQAHMVLETRKHQGVTRIAGLPDCVLGVVLFDGDFVPVVDLRTLFGVDETGADETELFELSERAAQLCVRVQGCCAALAVRDVRDVLLLAQHRVRPAPPPVADVARYIEGFAAHEGQVLVVLDLPVLLSAAGVRPGRAAALEMRLDALNATLARLREACPGGDSNWQVQGAAPAVDQSLEPMYDELLDYLEDAVGTARAALLSARDLDHGLRYPEQARNLIALLLGWIVEMLDGLGRYIDPHADKGQADCAACPVASGASAVPVSPGRGMRGRAAPLPKVKGGTRFDGSIEAEWESNKK